MPKPDDEQDRLESQIKACQACEESGGAPIPFPPQERPQGQPAAADGAPASDLEDMDFAAPLTQVEEFWPDGRRPENYAPWLTLAMIVGNEEHHIERVFEAFESWVDEIVLVRALGGKKPDRTMEIARARARKPLVLSEYRNDEATRAWPHVDNFARARQTAFDLARGTFVIWADCDDIISPDHAKQLRDAVDLGDFDVLFLPYCIAGHSPMRRERVIRRGCGRWVGAVHEAISLNHGLKEKARIDIEIWHAPKGDGQGKDKSGASLERNLRILEREIEPSAMLLFYLHRDSLLADKKEQALEWGKKALTASNLTVAEKYKVYYNLATMFTAMADFQQGESFAMNGIRLCPDRRECFALMSAIMMERKDWGRALTWIQLCRAITPHPPKQRPNWYDETWYGWRADLTEAFILRKLKAFDQANEIEDFGHGGNPKISLLHATRGRPEKAIAARDHVFTMALKPELIEHIFAIDADDAESRRELDGFRTVIVEPGGGCVRAWNAAAASSRGRVLVQMSDDWVLPYHWDNQIIWALKDPLEMKKPAVLAISDGHREDKLLCMAICTRDWYVRQRHEKTGERYLFHPDYLGMYSDNEFTVRAYEAGVVIERKDIVFTHNHPAFGDGELDRTYAEQNSPERYAHGLAVFNRRNPRYKIDPSVLEAPSDPPEPPEDELPASRPILADQP